MFSNTLEQRFKSLKTMLKDRLYDFQLQQRENLKSRAHETTIAMMDGHISEIQYVLDMIEKKDD